jgi:hypothetical protein
MDRNLKKKKSVFTCIFIYLLKVYDNALLNQAAGKLTS